LAVWQQDRAWANRFLPELKRICGEFLIGEASEQEDAEHNSDLLVLTLQPVRVACRIRRYSYLDKYAGEFTIRTGRPNGVLTELAKVCQGWGDYILYGFCDQAEESLVAWVLGDLKVFRGWFMQTIMDTGKTPGALKPNADGSSVFRVFRIDDLPPGFVVTRKRWRGARTGF